MNTASKLPPSLVLPAVLALLALAYLPQLGDPRGQTRPEEQFNMAVSAEMHRAGEWATPTLKGAHWFFKPPLLYWLQQVSYGAFGRTVFASRLPAALAAIALALATGLLARAMGLRAGLAALLCGGSLGVFMNGRLAITDAPLVLALTFAFAALWKAHTSGNGRWLGAAGALVGVAMLAKGPVAAVVFFVGGIAFVLLRPRPKPDPLLRPRYLALGISLAIAVAAPWYLLMLARHGQAFFDFFFVQMNVDRFRTPWRVASLGITWGGVLAALAPWTPLGVAAVVDALGRERRRDPRRLLALCWAAATMLVFSLPAQKFPHHILPAVPALALLVALLWQERRGSRAFRWGMWGSAFICAVVALAALVGARFFPTVESLALAVVAGLALAAFATRRLPAAAALCTGAIACSLAWLAPAAGFSPWPTAQVPDRPVNVYRQAPGLIELDSGRVVGYLTEPGQVEAALSRGELVWMTERDRPHFAHEIVAAQPRLRSDLPPGLLMRAVREGTMEGLLDRVIVAGRPDAAPPAP